MDESKSIVGIDAPISVKNILSSYKVNVFIDPGKLNDRITVKRLTRVVQLDGFGGFNSAIVRT